MNLFKGKFGFIIKDKEANTLGKGHGIKCIDRGISHQLKD
jgi:hypothetical protein